MIQLPKIVQVLRLLHREEIKNEAFNLAKIPLDSPEWKLGFPYKADLYYIKNHEKKVIGKAFYLEPRRYVPDDARWYHPTENEYIYNSSITHWMPIIKSEKEE